MLSKEVYSSCTQKSHQFYITQVIQTYYTIRVSRVLTNSIQAAEGNHTCMGALSAGFYFSQTVTANSK